MRLPLYLGAQASVRLDAGPSLVIAAPARIAQRCPLQRISRLLVFHGCQLPWEVLSAVLAAHIPVVMLGASGRAEAVCYPCQPQPLSQDEKIAMLHAAPDWRARYDAWLRAQLRMAVLSSQHCLGIHYPDLRPDRACRYLLNQSGLAHPWARRLMRIWQGCLKAWSLEQWQQRDAYTVRALMVPDVGWDLPEDVSRCLLWSLMPLLVQRSQHWRALMKKPGDQVEFACIQAVEQAHLRLQRLFDDINRRFCQWLEGQAL